MTSIRALALVLVAFALVPQAGQTQVPSIETIDAYVDGERRALRIPGLALAVVHGADLIHVAAFGSADGSGRRLSGDTPFVLGSTSKSFTALAIMQLVEEGSIELDAPVRRYLPWFSAADETASAAITVRHLLEQTSGFSTPCGRATLRDFTSTNDALERRVRALADVALTTPVGSTYQYSNCNYQILGLLVERSSGQGFEQYLQSHVFEPLEMRNSFTSKEPAIEHGLAAGHRAWFDHPVEFDEPFPRASVPQGFVISSARDMARYLTAQLDEGGLGSAVLSSEGIAELHRGNARQGDSDVYYAMGWNVGQIDGVKALWHEGDTFAYQSFMVLLPDDGWGIVLLSNLNNIPANQRFQEVAINVARLLTGRPPQSEHVHTSDWTHAVFVGAFLLQLIGIARTVHLVRRWRAVPASRPSGRIWRFMRVAVPATTNLAFGLFVLVGIPALFAPLSVLTWAVPDIGHLLVLGGGIALIWGVARSILVYRVLAPRA